MSGRYGGGARYYRRGRRQRCHYTQFFSNFCPIPRHAGSGATLHQHWHCVMPSPLIIRPLLYKTFLQVKMWTWHVWPRPGCGGGVTGPPKQLPPSFLILHQSWTRAGWRWWCLPISVPLGHHLHQKSAALTVWFGMLGRFWISGWFTDHLTPQQLPCQACWRWY